MARRRSSNSGEFEDRQIPAVEGGGLGDLTDDILYERGELDIPAGQKVPRGIPGAPGGVRAGYPPDVGYQQGQREEMAAESERGTLSQGADVRSVFDVRPINGRDWMVAADETSVATTDDDTVQVCFVVPEGYVGLLRQFRFEMVPQVPDADFSDHLLTILVDDIPQPNYENLPLGQFLEDWYPTYILANEMQRICLQMVATDVGSTEEQIFHATMHGNLLLRTGVPIEYEPGNPSEAQPIVRGTVLQAGGGVKAEPGRVARPPVVGRAGRGRAFRAQPSRYRRPTTTPARYVSRAERRRAAIAARRRGRY